MKYQIWRFLVLVLVVLMMADLSHAALRSIKDVGTQDPDAAWNPKKAEDDIILPMPNGLSMVFRAVPIPAKNPLYDKKFSLGVNQPEGERSMYELKVDSFVTAPFMAENLPEGWKKTLSAKPGYSYYFIGKYEISNAQWQAVMGGEIPQGQKPEQPRTEINWYDLQDFLRKYNTWLLAEHPGDLPAIDTVPAFLRLPTEEEWEFAARGGNLPPEKLEFEDFPLEDGHSIEDYAVFGDKFSEPKPIGSKRPNPLGLYDMAGNVAELTQSPFRFTIAASSGAKTIRRMHGANGGLVSKGGSFISSSETDIYPGKRVETKMFSPKDSAKNGKEGFVPFSSRNTGARLVLTSLNVPSIQRAKKLNEYLDAMKKGGMDQEQPEKAPKPIPVAEPGKDQKVNLDPNAPLLQELDKVIAAAGSPFMKSNLYQLRDMVEDNNTALERERDANLGNAIRTTIYKAAAINDMAYRCRDYYNVLQKADAAIKAKADFKKEDYEKIKKNVLSYFKLFDVYTNYYMLSVKDLHSQSDLKTIHAKIDEIKSEYSTKDLLSDQMKKNLDFLHKHITIVHSGGIDKLSSDRIWKDTLNPSLYDKIVELDKFSKKRK